MKRRWRKASLPCVILMLSGLMLSGCWDRHEINDLAIVLATGVDYADEQVQLTAQIFLPRKGEGSQSSSGGGGGSSPSGVTIIRTAKGETAAEAMNRLQRRISRELFWGHCEVIVLSEQAGKRGLGEYIDFFLRYPQFREHAYVFSSKGPARSILEMLDPLERSSAESLREMANLNLGSRVTLLELARSIEGSSRSAILSQLLVTSPNREDLGQQENTPLMKGMSLYKNDKYVMTVTEPRSVGVLMLANQLNDIILPVALPPYKGTISILLTEARTTIRPRIANQEWSAYVLVKANGGVVLNTTDADLSKPAVQAELRKAWANRLKELAEDALLLSQKELKADLFHFSDQFRRYYPKQWRAQQKEWEAIFPHMKVRMETDTTIKTIGKSTESQGKSGSKK